MPDRFAPRATGSLGVFTLIGLLLAFAASASAQLTVDYSFTTPPPSDPSIPDGGQKVYSKTLGGLSDFSNAVVRLNVSSASGSTMWLGDLYSTLTFGTATEGSRTAVLLNRAGRDNTHIGGSNLSSLNVTLDDTASTNIWSTTSTTGTYRSDGRATVNPAGPRRAFDGADYDATLHPYGRNAGLNALNGSAFTSNLFSLLIADYSAPNQATLNGWGMTLTGTAASTGTMSSGGAGGVYSINDGAGSTNTLGAVVDTTQNGSGGTLNVNLAGTTTFAGGMTGNGALNKQGAGTLILSGSTSHSGATTVATSGGTLEAAAAGALGSTSAITVNSSGTLRLSGSGNLNRVNNSAGITLAGGTIAINSGSQEGSAATVVNGSASGTNTVGLGALTLSATSTLDFDSGGNSTLMVFNSFIPAGFTLNITGYENATFDGTLNSGLSSDDRLVFNQELDSGQLGQINFGSGISATEIALGSGLWEVGFAAVPEPSTWAAGALALTSLLFASRKRLVRSARRTSPLIRNSKSAVRNS